MTIKMVLRSSKCCASVILHGISTISSSWTASPEDEDSKISGKVGYCPF